MSYVAVVIRRDGPELTVRVTAERPADALDALRSALASLDAHDVDESADTCEVAWRNGFAEALEIVRKRRSLQPNATALEALVALEAREREFLR